MSRCRLARVVLKFTVTLAAKAAPSWPLRSATVQEPPAPAVISAVSTRPPSVLSNWTEATVVSTTFSSSAVPTPRNSMNSARPACPKASFRSVTSLSDASLTPSAPRSYKMRSDSMPPRSAMSSKPPETKGRSMSDNKELSVASSIQTMKSANIEIRSSAEKSLKSRKSATLPPRVTSAPSPSNKSVFENSRVICPKLAKPPPAASVKLPSRFAFPPKENTSELKL